VYRPEDMYQYERGQWFSMRENTREISEARRFGRGRQSATTGDAIPGRIRFAPTFEEGVDEKASPMMTEEDRPNRLPDDCVAGRHR